MTLVGESFIMKKARQPDIVNLCFIKKLPKYRQRIRFEQIGKSSQLESAV